MRIKLGYKAHYLGLRIVVCFGDELPLCRCLVQERVHTTCGMAESIAAFHAE